MSNHIKILAEEILLFLNQGLLYEQNKEFIELKLKSLLETHKSGDRESRPDNQSDGSRNIEAYIESSIERTLPVYNPRIGED